MPLPRTPSEFASTGYRYESAASCGVCGRPVLWYRTPNGHRMCIDPVDYSPHRSVCKLPKGAGQEGGIDEMR